MHMAGPSLTNTIRYLLPVLWMTSLFQVIGPVDQNQARRHGSRGELVVYDCRLVNIRHRHHHHQQHQLYV